MVDGSNNQSRSATAFADGDAEGDTDTGTGAGQDVVVAGHFRVIAGSLRVGGWRLQRLEGRTDEAVRLGGHWC